METTNAGAVLLHKTAWNDFVTDLSDTVSPHDPHLAEALVVRAYFIATEMYRNGFVDGNETVPTREVIPLDLREFMAEVIAASLLIGRRLGENFGDDLCDDPGAWTRYEYGGL